MYDEYIFMNAACETNIRPTDIATSEDNLPSLSAEASTFNKGAAAASNAGKKLSLWNENNASTPPKTILRSDAGTTLSLEEDTLTLPMILTGAPAGRT